MPTLVPALVVVTCATLACGARPAADAPPLPTTARMSVTNVAGVPPVASSPSADVTPLYLGRFVFAAPAGATSALDDAAVDRIEIRPAGWSRDSSAAQVWAARVRQIEVDPVRRPPGVPSTVQIERQVDPQTRLLFAYASSAIPDARTAEALVDRGAASVWLRIPYGKGAEEKVLAGVARFSQAYRAEDGLTPRPEDAPAFHLPHGALVLPFGFEESLTAYVSAGASGLRDVAVSMATREDRDWGPGPIAEARAKAAAPLTAALGVRVEVLRARARDVAGLSGEEVITRGSADGKEPTLVFAWECRGADGAPLRPHVEITAAAGARDEARATAAWDRLLAGTRAVPQPAADAPSDAEHPREGRP